MKTSGSIVMHKNLTRERPFYAPQRVACDEKLLKVECCRGVVWVVTKERRLLVRSGICKGKEEGESWQPLAKCKRPTLLAFQLSHLF